MPEQGTSVHGVSDHLQNPDQQLIELTGTAEERTTQRKQQEREERVEMLRRQMIRRTMHREIFNGWSAHLCAHLSAHLHTLTPCTAASRLTPFTASALIRPKGENRPEASPEPYCTYTQCTE